MEILCLIVLELYLQFILLMLVLYTPLELLSIIYFMYVKTDRRNNHIFINVTNYLLLFELYIFNQ